MWTPLRLSLMDEERVHDRVLEVSARQTNDREDMPTESWKLVTVDHEEEDNRRPHDSSLVTSCLALGEQRSEGMSLV